MDNTTLYFQKGKEKRDLTGREATKLDSRIVPEHLNKKLSITKHATIFEKGLHCGNMSPFSQSSQLDHHSQMSAIHSCLF